MTNDQAVFLLADMLLEAALVSAPILGVCLVVGLIISLFQVVTQIQEMTLTFVPKLIAACVTLLLLGRWMLLEMVEFTTQQFQGIAQL